MAEEAICNVEVSYSVVWLDQTIERQIKSLDTKALLYSKVGGHLKTFDSPDTCVDYITSTHGKRIFLITSGAFGSRIVPLIYQSPQIQNIYVFCFDRARAEAWAGQCKKVTGIFTDEKSLMAKIVDDIHACSRDSHLPISVFHLEERQSSVQDLTEQSAAFMWHQFLLVALRSLARWRTSKEEMLKECYLYYQNNPAETVKIKKFAEEYTPLSAIRWYTSDCFIYRLLNKALRTQNIETVFKFRFFIQDLHYHIEKLYCIYLSQHQPISEHKLRLYRGQNLHENEVDLLRKNVGGLISMNTFLSATMNEQLAMLFAELDPHSAESMSMRSVLFTIDVQDISHETTPFAPIKNFSCYDEEEEILFDMGAAFNVLAVKEVNGIWYVHLQLSKAADTLNQDLFKNILQQVEGRASPSTLSWFLYRMNHFDKAERFALSVLEQLPENDAERGHTFNLLGLIYKDTGSLNKAVDSYREALRIFSLHPAANRSQLIATHCSLGLAYIALGDKKLAAEQPSLAETQLINSSEPISSLLTSMINSLKAKVYVANGNYPTAMKHLYDALAIKKRDLTPLHPSIGTTWKDIGIAQMKMDQDQDALKSFEEAVKIFRAALAPDHLDLVDCFIKIGDVLYKQREYARALKEFERALEIVVSATRDTEAIDDLRQRIDDTQKMMAESSSH